MGRKEIVFVGITDPIIATSFFSLHLPRLLLYLKRTWRQTRAIECPTQRVSFPTDGVKTVDMTRQSLWQFW